MKKSEKEVCLNSSRNNRHLKVVCTLLSFYKLIIFLEGLSCLSKIHSNITDPSPPSFICLQYEKPLLTLGKGKISYNKSHWSVTKLFKNRTFTRHPNYQPLFCLHFCGWFFATYYASSWGAVVVCLYHNVPELGAQFSLLNCSSPPAVEKGQFLRCQESVSNLHIVLV